MYSQVVEYVNIKAYQRVGSNREPNRPEPKIFRTEPNRNVFDPNRIEPRTEVNRTEIFQTRTDPNGSGRV